MHELFFFGKINIGIFLGMIFTHEKREENSNGKICQDVNTKQRTGTG